MLLESARSILVVIDLQERLLPAIGEGPRAVARTQILLAAAGHLEIPVAVTEQYPRGIGHTTPPIMEALPASATIHEKLAFSAASDGGFYAQLEPLRGEGRDQLVICGTEAHICVLQTALGFKRRGYEVFVVGDAVASRDPASVADARSRLIQGGCVWVNSEMVVFEWMERAGTDLFRSLVKLIK